MSEEYIVAALRAKLDGLAGIIPAVTITSVSVATNAVFTTNVPHLLQTGLEVSIKNTIGFTPDINGVFFVVVLSATTFTLQNTIGKTPIAVTIAGTGGSVQAYLTSWPNCSFQANLSVGYQRVDLIIARPSSPTQGGGYREERGTFQVTLVYPIGIGTGAIMRRAKLIGDAFAKGTEMQYGGVIVNILWPPELGSTYKTPDSFCMPVKIFYQANIFS